jgi:hypothetical protein
VDFRFWILDLVVARNACFSALLVFLGAVPLLAAAPLLGTQPLHVVPTSVVSYRLLSMSRDEDGFIWAGSIHQAIHRYHPNTGEVESIPLPSKSTASACICAGEKVYVLGQAYPRLVIYNRTTGAFVEKEYPSPKPDVWYGTEPVAGRYLYLFDRGGAGVIKWDTTTDTGTALPWPYKTPFPTSGQYAASDNALWCSVWDMTDAQYIPLGLARLNVANDEFTGWYPFPDKDAGLAPYSDPKTTFFFPSSLKGKVIPFDFKDQQWRRFLDVPDFGKRFGFLGGATAHAGRQYFSLSTYNGTDTGCDGQPYHFVNAILEFDPATAKFNFLTLEAPDKYYQIAYMLSAGGDFFATGTNIREANGALNGNRSGEVVFWQTLKPSNRGRHGKHGK